jgi:hypothetical protein
MGGKRAMRFASIDINTPTEQLDLSISQLSRMEDWDKLVAMNVNRWRGQVGLENSDQKWASGELLVRNSREGKVGGGDPNDGESNDGESNDGDSSDAEKQDDFPAIWVDVTGRPESGQSPMGSMAGAPFAGKKPPFANFASSEAGSDQSPASAADPHAGLPREAQEAIASGKMKAPGPAARPPSEKSSKTSPSGQTDSSDAESKLKYDRPEGWRDGRMSMMRMAAFNVGPEDAAAEVTVITAGGDLRGNVARWMGQIREGAVPDEEVDSALENAEKLEVGGREAQRFILRPAVASDTESADDAGPAKASAIDATIVPLEGGFSVFIKMTGPAAVIDGQSEQMKAFLKSLDF